MFNAGSVHAFDELGEREEKAPSNGLPISRAATDRSENGWADTRFQKSPDLGDA
jgi:hypothetical protein